MKFSTFIFLVSFVTSYACETYSTTNINACDYVSWNGELYTESGTYTYITTNTAGCDSIATLNLNIGGMGDFSTETILSITACDSYEWNGDTYTESGWWEYLTLSEYACDSLIVLDLTIITNDNTNDIIGQSQPFTGSLQSYNVPFNSGSTYSWGFKYNNAGSIINGQSTNIVEIMWGSTAETDMIYCVETDNNGCLGDTSFFNVTLIQSPTWIKEQNFEYKVYPNPSSGLINVELDLLKSSISQISMINYLGNIIFTEDLKQQDGQYNKTIDLGNKANGIYMLNIKTNNQNIKHKIIVQ